MSHEVWLFSSLLTAHCPAISKLENLIHDPHSRHPLGDQKERIEARLEGLDPDLKTYILEFAYGEIYARGGLELKFKELLACAMLMSLGASGELKTHLRGAFRAGATELELRETLLFAIPYLGFPRVISGFAVLKELLEESKG